MAYQLAIDLNYSEVFSFDENDFTIAGPGAVRGLHKCFINPHQVPAEQIIQWMVAHQEQEFSRLGLKFESLGKRHLHAIDCQGLFCETDKYCRVKFPELASNRSKIKAEYRPLSASIKYQFPPKWKLSLDGQE